MDKMSTRKAPINSSSASTINPESRTVRVVAATSNPVQVWSWERGTINEVLLMSGVQLPNTKQLPLLDCHSRESHRCVLGSARGFVVSTDALECELLFSATPDASESFQKIREGHITDVSIGYSVSERVWIPEGQKQLIEGRTFDGPLQVVTIWTPKEISIVPIGADPDAKTREEAVHKGKGKTMTTNEEGIRAETLRVERQRVTEIRSMGRYLNVPDNLIESLITEGKAVDEARAVVMSHLQSAAQVSAGFVPTGSGDFAGRVRIGREANEKRMDAIADGFALRAGCRIEKPAPGWNEYRHMSLIDLARESLIAAGISARGLSPVRVAELATRASTSADFPLLMANVANKVLRTAYEEVPSTWETWCKIGDGRDFKEMSRVALSEAEDLDLVPEHGTYHYSSLTDSAEKFSIYTYGKMFAITRQAIVNDDLGAFTRIPQMWAGSAKRKINSLVYSILTSNANMSDGAALFVAGHSNLGTAGVISITTLTEGRKMMRLQTGPQGAVLNISPKYLIVPAALETVAEQVLESISLDAGTSGNPAIVNPFRGQLTPVVEALLDASSITAWYLAAGGGFDTVEVCFLDGQRAPYLEAREGWTVDGLEYKARIDVGTKAIDWRGLFKNAGA